MGNVFPYCAGSSGCVEWRYTVTQIDLSPVATTVSDAASAEHFARDKWARAGKALARLGIVSGMLTRSTKQNPNELFDESVYDQIRGFVVQGVSASKKGMMFQATVPGSISAESPKGSTRWTVADLLGLSREALRDIDDDVLKTQRRTYMMLIDGPMMSRIRQYIDIANGVEKKKEPKAKQEEKNEEVTLPNDDKIWIQFLESIRANVPGRKSWPSDDIVAVQDSAARMIALITRNK